MVSVGTSGSGVIFGSEIGSLGNSTVSGRFWRKSKLEKFSSTFFTESSKFEISSCVLTSELDSNSC